MPQPKVDVFKAAVILIVGALLVYLLVKVADSDIAVFFPSAG